MKSVIRWAIKNAPAMNTLMAAVLIVGAYGMSKLRREVFPEFDLDIILVTVEYPGASPDEVETGICLKIEEAVRSVDGIKKQTSIAREGSGFLLLELRAGTNVQKTLNEVRSEVDSIPSFPETAEQPDVKPITFRLPAIKVGVVASASDDPAAHKRLREVTERIRDDLLQLPTVSQANIIGAREYQIDIEISEDKLREHGLTLQQVAQIVRRENVELPGGSMKTHAQEVLMRVKNKQLLGTEIARIPIVRSAAGDVLTVADLGQVKDEFGDETLISLINGRPGLGISVDRTKSEDLLAMTKAVRRYVADHPVQGYELAVWSDQSLDVADRMEMLLRNGLQGLALVFLVLAIFLELRLAFWVALGIPIAVLGASAGMWYDDQTLNMLSMFAFLMALGIVVDDAIVIGENIYRQRESGKEHVQAAVDGTHEVLPSVGASVCTTIIAFVPMLFVAGMMGKFIAIMPVVVIAMLIISLIESTFILPCHLAHDHGLIFRILGFVLWPLRGFRHVFTWLNRQSAAGLSWLVDRWYLPVLNWAIRAPAVMVSIGLGLLLLVGGLIQSGIVPFVIMPPLDSRAIEARIIFPDGTPARVTDAATEQIEHLLLEINQRYVTAERPRGIVRLRHRMVGWLASPNDMSGLGGAAIGDHLGSVTVELVESTDRDITSDQLMAEWRRQWEEKCSARYPGAESITFESQAMGPGGKAVEFKLLGNPDPASMEQLEAAVEECKGKLAGYRGVLNIDDDSRPGKWEYQIKIKEKAKSMGISLADLAETVRASYYGEEVMRLQRGRHEVKLMVRYPRDTRRSAAAFDEIRVRTGDGSERPLTELADVAVTRGYSEINRVHQKRSITVTADVDKRQGGNANQVVSDLQAGFMRELLAKYPLVSVRWEGQREQSVESIMSLIIGFFIALLGMFVLLTLEFRSYIQPLIILAIVPFGLIGATIGHVLLGLEFTLFSFFGMVALTGVVVNDSIVLVDFINSRVRDGVPLYPALIDAGRLRFRPVLLTSITTIAGLTPVLLEKSFQAQMLIPMATSLCFGLALATTLILLLIPTFYVMYARVSMPGVPMLPPATPAEPAPEVDLPDMNWVPETEAETVRNA